jgi:hypothetical protein
MSVLLPLTLAAIMSTDPLGYECIPEDRLEVAFALGGKGMRLPQTCIPEPCEETLTELTLASYSGYRDRALYEDYRQRMSRICGTPTKWEELGIDHAQLLWAVFDGGSPDLEVADDDIPTHSPVPAPFLLLASATALLGWLKRRAR